jgi:hypothetical protein
MTDDDWKRICDNYADENQRFADRIEKLEAGEIEFDRVIEGYASENAQFRDRIEKLEAALRMLRRIGAAALYPKT